MKVKELVEHLLKLDQELNVGKQGVMGTFVPLDETDINKMSVMSAKSDTTYTTWVDDPVWKNKRKEFNDPFEIIVVG